MGLFKRKSDPISARARQLSAEIRTLQNQIQKLNSQLGRDPARPRVRSTALPQGETLATAPPAEKPAVKFEEIELNRARPDAESATTPEHYNELGVRKYDLVSAWRRLLKQFRGQAATNPRLINYLAAGSIQGLRPLRFEKRVARNRFLALFGVLVVVLLGIFWMLIRNH